MKLTKTQNKVLSEIEARGSVQIDLHEEKRKFLAASKLVEMGILDQTEARTGFNMIQISRMFGRVGGSKMVRHCLRTFSKKQ